MEKVFITEKMLNGLPTSIKNDIEKDLDYFKANSLWNNIEKITKLVENEKNKKKFIMDLLLPQIEREIVESEKFNNRIYSAEEVITIVEDYWGLKPEEEIGFIEGWKNYLTGTDKINEKQLFDNLPNYLQDEWETMKNMGFKYNFIKILNIIEQGQKGYLLKKIDNENRKRFLEWEKNENYYLTSVETYKLLEKEKLLETQYSVIEKSKGKGKEESKISEKELIEKQIEQKKIDILKYFKITQQEFNLYANTLIMDIRINEHKNNPSYPIVRVENEVYNIRNYESKCFMAYYEKLRKMLENDVHNLNLFKNLKNHALKYKNHNQILQNNFLGQGSYGAAFLGKNNGLNIPIIIKWLKGDKNETLATMTTELNVSRFKHKHIMELFGASHNNNSNEIIIPNINTKKDEIHHLYSCIYSRKYAGDLDIKPNKGDPLFSENKAKIYIRQLLSALNYIHNNGIVHRDIKPENIFKKNNEDVVLADFGIMLELGKKDETEGMTKMGKATEILIGANYSTPTILPPERAFEKHFNKKFDLLASGQDIWAIGCTLYYLVKGDFPFDSPENQLYYFGTNKPQPYYKPQGLSSNLQHLLNKIFDVDISGINSNFKKYPSDCLSKYRYITVDEVLNHPWMK